MIYWVQKNKNLLMVLGLISLLGYVIYSAYTRRELSNEANVAKTEASQAKKEATDAKEELRLEQFEFNRSSLGYSLNNPGNIRVSSSKYRGEVPTSSAFKQFSSMKHGFRAMTALLHTYIKSGYNTVDKIVNRWAPSSDGNNPGRYAANVAKNANVKRDQVLTVYDFRNGNLMNIIYSMTRVEQGYAPNIRDLNDGFVMYLNEEQL